MTRTMSWVLVAVMACGNSGVSSDGPTSDAVVADAPSSAPSLAELCEPGGLIDQMFSKLFDCNPEFELFLERTVGSADIQAFCEGNFSGYVTDGTVVIGTRAAFDACQAYVQTLTCDTLDLDETELSPCEDVFDGTVATNGVCEENTQCDGAAYCDTLMPGTCGTCQASKPNGMQCQISRECQSQRCATEGMTSVCRPLATSGGACMQDRDCVGGLICSDGTCGSRTVAVVGDACDPNNPIDSCDAARTSLYCDEATSRCRAFADVGEACVPLGDPGVYCNLLKYESCANNLCVAPSQRVVGQTCGMQVGLKCDATSRCSEPFTGGVCELRSPIGGACQAADDCADIFTNCVADKCQYGSYTGMCP